MTSPSTPLRALFQTHLASKNPNTQGVYLTALQRLEAWAERDELDVVQLETADLERFLAEEGRHYSSATVHVRRAALHALYASLENAGIIELDPSYKLRLASIDHLASTGPIEYITDEEITRLRKCALQLGPISSLAICMLHETPASVRQIAHLVITDIAHDTHGKPYAILGQSIKTKTPWPISHQILDAVEALRGDQPRLISPLTKNPNVAMVREAIERTRLSANLQTPSLAEVLKHDHRCRVQELSSTLRLAPRSLLRYQRALLKEMTPLAPRG